MKKWEKDFLFALLYMIIAPLCIVLVAWAMILTQK